MADTYKIIRFFAKRSSQTIATGQTLEQAQAHCNDPETSSKTCTKASHKAITLKYGPWFDGYQKEQS